MTKLHKIVMIDDEVDLCLAVKENLEETGRFEVKTLSDPMQAEQFVAAEQPDVILLDVVMLKRDGREVIGAIKKDPELRTIPVIVVSGKGEMVYNKRKNEFKWTPNSSIVKERGDLPDAKGAEELAQAYAVEDYLAKPFATETMISVIDDVLKRFKKAGDQEEE